MKITKEQLAESDYDTLFTRDPGAFIEAIIINLLWAKGDETEAAIIARQRSLFESWLRYYTQNVVEGTLTTERELTASSEATRIAEAEARGELRGRIAALSNLPMKKSLLSSYVDLIEVANILRELKAQEPIGVTNHATE